MSLNEPIQAPIQWLRATRWQNRDVCILVDRKPSSITETEKKFIKLLFWSCRNDNRFKELSDINILALIQTHLEAADDIMVGTIKKYNLPTNK